MQISGSLRQNMYIYIYARLYISDDFFLTWRTKLFKGAKKKKRVENGKVRLQDKAASLTNITHKNKKDV